MRVLIAPDSFKGTFSAHHVATHLAAGVAAAGDQATCMPVADGGEGTLGVLLAALGGERVPARVVDPLGRWMTAPWGRVAGRSLAIVETAMASGLYLVDVSPKTAWAASSAGTGQLVAAAARAGAQEILVSVGGSATSDGGRGAVDAIAAAGGLRGARLTVLCDVTTPYELAAVEFGPQKGATDQDVVSALTRRLHEVAASLPRDPRGRPLTGAAGGLSGALWATFGATLVSGADRVLDAVGFDDQLARADCVLTGEGRLDAASHQGKLVGEVARRSRAAGVPVFAVVGSIAPGLETDPGLTGVLAASTAAELRAAWPALRPAAERPS